MSTLPPDELADRGKNAAMLILVLSPLIGWVLTAHYLRQLRGQRWSAVAGRALLTTAVWVVLAAAIVVRL